PYFGYRQDMITNRPQGIELNRITSRHEHHWKSLPQSIPTQKLPTKAILISQSLSLPMKTQTDASRRSRAGRNSEKDKNTSEGKCNGSNDGGGGGDDDDDDDDDVLVEEYDCDTAG